MASSINPFILAVDFDGTLCENTFPIIGEVKQDILDKVIDLQEQGAFIILWTCREGDRLEEAVDWCKQHGLIPDAVNDEAPWIKEAFNTGAEIRTALMKDEKRCGGKIFANMYLDDRAINVNDF